MSINRKVFSIITVIVLITICAAFGGGNANADNQDDITLEVKLGRPLYAAGDTVVIGVKASIPQGYHLYSNPLGPGIGKPLNLSVNRRDAGGEGRRVPWSVDWVEARKSVPKKYNPPVGGWVWAYESEAYFFIKGVMRRDSVITEAPPASVLTYEAVFEALMCKAACVPIIKSVPFELPLPVDKELASASLSQQVVRSEMVVERSRTSLSRREPNDLTPNTGTYFPSSPVWQSRYAKSEPVAFSVGVSAPAPVGININLSGLSIQPGIDQSDIGPGPAESQTDQYQQYNYSPIEERREYSLLTAVLFALLAGLALNLTPCIFPMLSVRVLSFAQSSGESRRSAVIRSAVFSLGIVAVFLLLAGLAAFAGFSWGQQFQNPGMMVGIIAIVFLFALGMFNFYTLSVPSIGGGGKSGDPSFAGDFLKGAAATVMATPCGGPFLGALLAWALLQRPVTIFALFAAMGVGMAFPYVLLASSKRLMSLLPKPGRWIEDLKNVMGFLLLAFAVNMMRSLDPSLITTAVGICLSILIAASVNKRFTQFGMPAARRAVVVLISLILLAAGIAVSVTYLRIDARIFNEDQPGVGGPYWMSFSEQALTAAHEEKRNVIVNFTASWCTNCKLNKAAVFNTAAAKQLYREKNILLLTADITSHNPEAQELLHHLGSRSVPFLAIFPGDAPKSPVVMRDIISREKFLGELRNLP